MLRTTLHLFLMALAALRAFAVVPENPVEVALRKTVLPAITERCFDCHDADSAKGDINLDILNGHGDARFDIRLWDKVRGQLRAGTMPPKNKPQPTVEQKHQILDWISLNEKAVLESAPADPGVRKLRRLTRHEYNHTLRDLLGVSVRPGHDFPADGAGGEGFENNADTLFLPTLLIEKYLAGADQALEEVYRKPELKARLFKEPAPPAAILRPFLNRAFRRPVTDAELNSLADVAAQAVKRGAKFDEAMRLAFKAALVSPHFLLLRERDRPDEKKPWAVDGYELATRLSYFLWSSMPDDELFGLAASQKLQDDATLEAQTKRMLADPKAEALTRHFAASWLGFEELFNSVDPDRQKFPVFTDALRQSIYDEAFVFTDRILRRNGRVLDFLDSDYTFVNEPLARLYGIPGVQGPALREVKFTDNRRGGLLGMAAILTATSFPQRTSPVLRGKWVLEQILGTPPPPPPPNVPKLEEDDRKLKKVTLRQRLEAHRGQAVCAGCHARLDPPGFALENFDAIGQWRDLENGKPVDSSGVTPAGKTFNGPAEFRKLLLEEKDRFIRVLATRLLGYALNRGLEVCDQPTLLRLEDVLKKSDYRSEAMIVALVKSYPFRYRR